MTSPALVFTLCFVCDPTTQRVLLMQRSKDRAHLPGVLNGLGGKLLPGEAPIAAAQREIEEESGLIALDVTWRGTESWICTEPDGALRDQGTLFLCTATQWRGTLRTDEREGQVGWYDLATALADPRLAPNLATILLAMLSPTPVWYAGIARYVTEGEGQYRLVGHGVHRW